MIPLTAGRIGSVLMGAFIMTGMVAAQAVGADKPTPKAHEVLETFDYHGVTLEGDLRRQFDEVRDFYLKIPNDDMLKPYRERAGKPAPGVDMGGCYVGHNPFGQFLGGYARMYAATGDIRCKNKALTLMRGWAECIEPDGFFLPMRNPELIPYYYEKMLGGLLDIYTYIGDPKALDYLRTITGWADKHMSRVRLYANPVTNDGGEWYTMSENLYRAYMITGDEKYRELAETYEYKDYWDFFAKKGDIFTRDGWYHAYSHVNAFNGLASAYMVKGDEHYLTALKNAYDWMQENECMATGGYGPNETLMPRSKLELTLLLSRNSFETQCGSWAGFKMTKHLIGLTGDAKYGDWTERLMLNGIGASIPMDANGKPFYYSDYNLTGAVKKNIDAQWPCCSGARPEAVSDYHDLIYFKDANDLYVNLYAASSVKWGSVTVSQNTQFPENSKVDFTISTNQPKEFALKLRVPGWLAGPMEAKVNGEAVSIRTDSEHWAEIRRTWNDGDKLTVKLPMGFWLSRLEPGKEFPAAIMYGPVTMAVRADAKNPAEGMSFDNLAEQWLPNEGEPLNFHLASNRSVLLRPFYQYKQGEKYFMYLDPKEDFTYRGARYEGSWIEFPDWMASNSPASTAEYAFVGKGFKLKYWKFDDCGKLEVKVDDAVVGTIDEYGPGRGDAAEWEYKGLSEGKHTVKLTVLGEKAPESKGIYANVGPLEPITE